MLDTKLLREQLRRTNLLKKSAEALRFRPHVADFTVISTVADGKHFRCLFGEYHARTYEPVSLPTVEEHFGLTRGDAGVLFGANAPLSHREDIIDAHIAELSMKIEQAAVRDAA